MADQPAESKPQVQKQKAEVKRESKVEVEYTQPTSQRDLERRLSEDYQSPLVTGLVAVNPNPVGAEDENYVGTDPVYQNYAEDVHKPLAAEEGVEQKAEEQFKESALSHQNESEVKTGDESFEAQSRDPLRSAKEDRSAVKAAEAQAVEERKSDARGPFADNQK